MSTIVKVEQFADVVDAQMKFWDSVPNKNKPRNLRRIDDKTIVYERVMLEHPRSSKDVRTLMKTMETIWKPCSGDLGVPVSYYRSYVFSKTPPSLASNEEFKTMFLNVPLAVSLTHCKNCHGDLTLENVLVQDDRVVLLDPARTHSLLCVEQDEAKLLQSIITQWEVAKRGWEYCTFDVPFRVRFVHLYLLLAHWIRILPYETKHGKSVHRYSLFVVENLSKKVMELYYGAGSSSGYRRCLTELRRECISFLQRCNSRSEKKDDR